MGWLKNTLFESDKDEEKKTTEEAQEEIVQKEVPEQIAKTVDRSKSTTRPTPLQSTITHTPSPPRHINDVENGEKGTEKFREFFNKVLTNANLDGNDYYEFRKALDAQSGYGLTEIQMFQSVYAVLASQGCDIPTLLNSGKHYLQVLESEKTGFEEALLDKRAQEIDQRKSNISAYEEENKLLEKQIEDIRSQMEQNREMIAQEMQSINDAERELRESEENFNRAFTTVTDQITKDMSKIEQYLVSKTTSAN